MRAQRIRAPRPGQAPARVTPATFALGRWGADGRQQVERRARTRGMGESAGLCRLWRRVRMFAAGRTGEGGDAGQGRYRRRMAGPAARYDRIADFYDAKAGQTVTDPATAALLDLAGDVRGMRLLDVACGPGRVARELARRGAQVTGLDLSAALLAKARAYEERGPLGITYVQGDATARRALGGQVFDGATCNFGLSDIDDLDGQPGPAGDGGRMAGLLTAPSLLPRLGPGRAEQLATGPGVLPRRVVAGQQSRLPRPGRFQPPDAVDLPQLPDRPRVRPGAGNGTPPRPRLGTAAARCRAGAALPGRPVPTAVA